MFNDFIRSLNVMIYGNNHCKLTVGDLHSKLRHMRRIFHSLFFGSTSRSDLVLGIFGNGDVFPDVFLGWNLDEQLMGGLFSSAFFHKFSPRNPCEEILVLFSLEYLDYLDEL